MFGFFKKDKENNRQDAKGLRDAVLQFIKEELQQLDGGEGKAVAALQLFVQPADQERFLYEAALYTGNPEELRSEIQRIADNYAIGLPESWKLELLFVDALPADAAQDPETGVALKLTTAAKANPAAATGRQGRITILKGKAEQDEYLLLPGAKRMNIGRERNIQANDGSFRINDIAFPEDPAYESNKYISRQHGHIEWDVQTAAFKFFADEGGVPPGNKTKIRSAADESVYKINSSLIGYPLNDGDQVILGDAAVLLFTVVL